MIHNHYPTIEDLRTGEIEIERELESLRNERIWRKSEGASEMRKRTLKLSGVTAESSGSVSAASLEVE